MKKLNESKIFIDKLGFTVKVSEKREQRVLRRLEKIRSREKYSWVKSALYKPNKATDKAKGDANDASTSLYGGFKYNQGYMLKCDGFEVYIQAQPQYRNAKKPQNFLRFELNPSNYSRRSIKRLIRLIRYLGCVPVNVDVATRMRITRLDFALDFIGLHVSEILMLAKWAKDYSVYFNELTGQIETVVAGGPYSACKSQVYDKIAEANKKVKGYITKPGPDSISRIETKCKAEAMKPWLPKTGFKMDDLYSINFPFRNIILYTSSLSEIHFPVGFIESAKSQGLAAALDLRPESKEGYKSILKSYELPLLQDKLLWTVVEKKRIFSVLELFFDLTSAGRKQR